MSSQVYETVLKIILCSGHSGKHPNTLTVIRFKVPQRLFSRFFDTIFSSIMDSMFSSIQNSCLSFSIIRKLSNIITCIKFFTVNALNGLGPRCNVCILYQCSLELPNDSGTGVSRNDQNILWEAGIWNLHMLNCPEQSHGKPDMLRQERWQYAA